MLNPVSDEIKIKVYEHGRLGREAKAMGDLQTAEAQFLLAWESLPEPKVKQEFSESLAMGLATFYRDTDRPDNAKKWLSIAEQIYGNDEASLDTLMFLRATILLAAAEFEAAYLDFESLHKKLGNRPFQGKDRKYLEFFRTYKKPWQILP